MSCVSWRRPVKEEFLRENQRMDDCADVIGRDAQPDAGERHGPPCRSWKSNGHPQAPVALSPNRLASEQILARNAEHVARAFEVAHHAAERGRGVVDVAVVDPQVGVAGVEAQLVAVLVAETE